MKKRATLADVAKAAGVSTATVSLVMRDSPQIPQKTKRSVRAAAERIGYVYNQSAANLRGFNQTLIGMVMSGSSNRFNAEVVSDISRLCAENGKLMLYGDANEDVSTQHQIFTRMIENNVDGILVCAAEGSKVDDFDLVLDHGIRVIQILRRVSDLAASYIGFDNIGAAEKLTTNLISEGHRSIGFLGGYATSSSREERRIGYQLALQKKGLRPDPQLEISTPVTRQAGYEGVEKLLAMPEPPTAVFCYNDVVAYGAMLYLSAAGIVAGRDLAVAGFDDLPESSLWSPALTSVALDRGGLVTKAYSAITTEPTDEVDANTIITPKIIHRESTLNWVSAKPGAMGV